MRMEVNSSFGSKCMSVVEGRERTGPRMLSVGSLLVVRFFRTTVGADESFGFRGRLGFGISTPDPAAVAVAADMEGDVPSLAFLATLAPGLRTGFLFGTPSFVGRELSDVNFCSCSRCCVICCGTMV